MRSKWEFTCNEQLLFRHENRLLPIGSGTQAYKLFGKTMAEGDPEGLTDRSKRVFASRLFQVNNPPSLVDSRDRLQIDDLSSVDPDQISKSSQGFFCLRNTVVFQ